MKTDVSTIKHHTRTQNKKKHFQESIITFTRRCIQITNTQLLEEGFSHNIWETCLILRNTVLNGKNNVDTFLLYCLSGLLGTQKYVTHISPSEETC